MADRRRNSFRHLAITALISLACLIVPTTAAALESYTQIPIAYCYLLNGGGSYSDTGTLAFMCGHSVGIQRPGRDAVYTDLQSYGFCGYCYAGDVAISPDGRYAVVPHPGGGIQRFIINANDTIAPDTSWIAQKPQMGAYLDVNAYYTDVDAWGGIYAANGSTLMSAGGGIVKYASDGKVVANFGVGMFTQIGGVGVTRDGRSVYVADPSLRKILRFDYDIDGNYHFKSSWGSAASGCGIGAMSYPVDVGVDPWGAVYVVDATCGKVVKFDGLGNVLADIPVGSMYGGANGLIVDRSGNVNLFEVGVGLHRMASAGIPPVPVPLPARDSVPPVINSMTVPGTVTTRTVPVTISATDNATLVKEYRYSNDSGVWGSWLPYVQSFNATITSTYGTKSITVQVRDGAFNESLAVTRQVDYPAPPTPLDTTAPTISSFLVPTSSASLTVTASLVATDNVRVTEMRFANESGAWGSWKAFASSSQVTLTGGAGQKTVSVQVRDSAQNASVTMSKTVTYTGTAPCEVGCSSDTTAPTLTNLTVPATTTTQSISASVVATDNVAVTQMRFGDGNGAWSEWNTFSATATVTLTSGFGSKTVAAQVRDAAGNVSATLTKTTLYDESPPPCQTDCTPPADTTAPIITNFVAPATTAQKTISLLVDADDNVGVVEMRFSVNGGSWTAWGQYTDTPDVTLPGSNGEKNLVAQVRDGAGNESATVSRNVTLTGYSSCTNTVQQCPNEDTTRPRLTLLTVPTPVAAHTIQVQVGATDNVGVTQMRFGNELGAWAPWQPYSTSATIHLSAGEGVKEVDFQVRDEAGNTSLIGYRPTTVRLVCELVAQQTSCPEDDHLGGPYKAVSLSKASFPSSVYSRTVLLRTVVTNAVPVEIRVGPSSDYLGQWQPYSSLLPTTLPAGLGMKQMYVQVRSADGAESEVRSATTILNPDLAPQVKSASFMVAKKHMANLRIRAVDDRRVVKVRTRFGNGKWSSWKVYRRHLKVHVRGGAGGKTAWVQVADNGGNRSRAMRARSH